MGAIYPDVRSISPTSHSSSLIMKNLRQTPMEDSLQSILTGTVKSRKTKRLFTDETKLRSQLNATPCVLDGILEQETDIRGKRGELIKARVY